MQVLTKAIEAGDTATVASIFTREKFKPPKLLWRPSTAEIEIPELRFLLNYWLKLQSGAALPRIKQVDALDLAPCLGYLMVLDIGQDELTYRVYGSKIAQASGFDMTGKSVSSIATHALIPVFFNACYRAVQTQKAPLLTQHQAPVEISVFHWTRLILPLANEEGEIARFLVGNYPGPKKIDSERVSALSS